MYELARKFALPTAVILIIGVILVLGLTQQGGAEVVDKKVLSATIMAEVGDLENPTYLLAQEDFTAESWTAYTRAITAATAVVADAAAEQSEIDAAIAAVEAEKAALVWADQKDLDIILPIAGDLTEANYTDLSWAVLSDALALPETTNTAIVAKTTAIKAAMEELIFSDQGSLDKAIMSVGGLTEADYTDSSWAVLIDAFALPESTNSQVVAKTKAVNDAIMALVFSGQADLDIAISIVGDLTESDYTVASWEELTTALTLPESANSQVLAKSTAITDAIGAFIFANQADLDIAISAAGDLAQADYTAKSWELLTDALALPESTNLEVVAKSTAIKAAMNALVFAGKADFSEAKDAASLLEDADYANYSIVTVALTLPETTNSEVVAKTKAINDAIEALIFAGQADLDIAISIVGDLTESGYTVASWEELTTASTLPESANLEVVAKTKAVNNAIMALVFSGQADLDIAISIAGDLIESGYTVASWEELTNAFALPESANSQVLAKSIAITDAIGALIFANQVDLDIAVSVAGDLVQTDYTAKSWELLTDSLALPESTNLEVVAKTKAVNDAIMALVFAGQTDLDKAISAAGDLAQADYTDSSWAVLTDALALPESANSEVVEKSTAINAAMNVLVFAGKADLREAKDAASLLEEVDYANYSIVTVALTLPETTNLEVVAKTKAVTDAIEALVFAGQADLEIAKTSVAGLTEIDYTEATWVVLTDALALPESRNSEVVAKSTAITDAIGAFIFANQANLDIAVSTAGDLAQADYTTASWDLLTDALALPESTNYEVIAKTKSVNDEIMALVFTGKADLDAAKTAATDKLETDYSLSSWTLFESALTPAWEMPETTNAEVVAKTGAINDAMALLTVDKSILTGTITDEVGADHASPVYVLLTADYTEATWMAYESAVTAAIAVEADESAVQSEIDTAEAVIGTEKAKLVFAGKADLDVAKAAVAAKLEADYSTASWTSFKSDMTTAEEMPETTNAEVVAKTGAINDAIAFLTVDKSALTDAINVEVGENHAILAYVLLTADYTETTWSAFASAITAAIAVEADVEAVQSVINLAEAAIGITKNALEFAGQADLDSVVTAAGYLDETDYTAGSWADLETALVMNDSTNAEIVAKATAIADVIEALEFAGQADLAAAELAAAAKIETDYSVASWTLFESAMATAGEMPDTTNAEVVAKALAINDAIAFLTVDKDALTAAITAEVGVDHANLVYVLPQEDYTDATWIAYADAITTAIAVEAGADAVQSEIDTAEAAVGTEKAALVFVGQAALDAAITSAGALEESEYTTSSWADLETALVMIESTNTEVVSKTIAINDAIGSLVTIINITVIEVTAPVRRGTPVATITETDQYTGTVTWLPAESPFASETVYTATINLTPKEGFSLTGVATDSFTVAGATSVTNDENSGVITAVFPATAADPPERLLDAAAGSDFIGALYTWDGNLYYKQKSLAADEWESETLLDAGTYGKMEIDDSGNPHVVYTNPAPNGYTRIGYKTYAGSTWTADYIESTHDEHLTKPDIAVDSNNHAHITYGDPRNRSGGHASIMYAENSSGSFRIELVREAGNWFSSGPTVYKRYAKGAYIVLDDDNNYYIMTHYYHATFNQTKTYRILVFSAESEIDLARHSIRYNWIYSDLYNIYDLIFRNGKLSALYKTASSQVKVTELTVAAGGFEPKQDKLVIGISSAYSHDTALGDIVVASKYGSSLRYHYNNTSKIIEGISVTGAVSIVQAAGNFYAVYTDSSDGEIKTYRIVPPTITEIDVSEEVGDISVALGTSEGDAIAGLTDTVTIKNSYEAIHAVPVNWTIADYNGNESNDYVATGTFELPAGVYQSEPETVLEVTALVTVKESP